VRLTHAQHVVSYSVERAAAVLRVDEEVVVRKYVTTRRKAGEPHYKLPFQLSDGDSRRSCSVSAYYRNFGIVVQIARVTLTVDGRLLYDEDPTT
jgi:hypothetical protein